MIPKKPAPDLIRGGNRFSEKIMLSKKSRSPATNELRPVGGAASRNHVPGDAGIGGRVVRGLSIRNTVAGGSAGAVLAFLRRPSRVYHHVGPRDMDKRWRSDL